MCGDTEVKYFIRLVKLVFLVLYSWPEFKHLHTINAHPANCICIEFDKSGK